MIIAICLYIGMYGLLALAFMFLAAAVLWIPAGMIGSWRRRRRAIRAACDDWIDVVEAARGRRGDTCPDCQLWDAAGDRPVYVPCVIHDEAYWQQLGSEVTS